MSILAEPTVAVVDTVVDKKGTRAAAEAYLKFWYTKEGQEVAALGDEINLADLSRPRSYEDVRVFETSRRVVERLVSHIGSIDED